MKKYATSVILQSYSSSKTGRSGTQRAPSPKTDGPVVVAPPSNRGRPVATDPSRGFPSPKSSHVAAVKGQRRSPFPDYHEEHQTWLSLSGNENLQSTDAAEQQSAVMSSVVLEPEGYHKLKKFVEDQKHQHSSSRPSNKVSSTNVPATSTTPVMGPPSTPNKALLDDRLNTSITSNNNANNSMNLGSMAHASDDHHHHHAHHHPQGYHSADDDGAMSDRTQATAHLWSQSHPSHANDTKESPIDAHGNNLPMEDSVLSAMSIDDIMQMQIRLQREMERRARAATTPQNVVPSNTSSASILPPPAPASGMSPASVPVLTGSPFTVSNNNNNNNNNSFVDMQAVESRKSFKRTKSGGNESAFNTMIPIATTSASSSRARTPVSNVAATTNTGTGNATNNGSKLMSNFLMMAGSSHKLDWQAVEREDPELLSVHSDVTNGNATSANLNSHTPSNYHATNNTNSSSATAHVPYYATSGNSAHSVAPQTSFQQVNGTSSISSSKGGQPRPVSRTNGALHPHDKMLYGHRNTALPCLSPMDQQPNAYATSSPSLSSSLNASSNDGFYYYNNNLNNINAAANNSNVSGNNNQSSRSSSRAPSRGVVLANFEDRLNNPAAITPLANHSNRSHNLGGNSFTAGELDEVMIPIEAVNISSVSSSNNNANAHNHNNEMTLDQFLSANRPSNAFAFFSSGSVTNQQREISRSELTVSPHCAFDDRSQGSQSVTSSISSRQQKQPRHPSKRSSQRQSRRESTQTTASNGTASSTASVVVLTNNR